MVPQRVEAEEPLAEAVAQQPSHEAVVEQPSPEAVPDGGLCALLDPVRATHNCALGTA